MKTRHGENEQWEAPARQADFQPARMAKLCRITLRHLERLCHERFQKTPSEWVRELQCRLAKELIMRGYSNKEVAAELKFASESHFCREFKKIYGVSPRTLAPFLAFTCRQNVPLAIDAAQIQVKQAGQSGLLTHQLSDYALCILQSPLNLKYCRF